MKEKIWANFQRIIELFTQKIVTKLSKMWIWDPRSGIRKKPIPDHGSRGQKGTGSRIRIRNTGIHKSVSGSSISKNVCSRSDAQNDSVGKIIRNLFDFLVILNTFKQFVFFHEEKVKIKLETPVINWS